MWRRRGGPDGRADGLQSRRPVLPRRPGSSTGVVGEPRGPSPPGQLTQRVCARPTRVVPTASSLHLARWWYTSAPTQHASHSVTPDREREGVVMEQAPDLKQLYLRTYE